MDAYRHFTIKTRLNESLHIYSTQFNEAMHDSVENLTPKIRTYSASMTLTNRVTIAIGTSNLSYLIFWE